MTTNTNPLRLMENWRVTTVFLGVGNGNCAKTRSRPIGFYTYYLNSVESQDRAALSLAVEVQQLELGILTAMTDSKENDIIPFKFTLR
jgi:hypothetical protein